MFTLLDLGAHDCKWPVNAPPRGGQYFFCGEPRFDGGPYCELHNRMGYQRGTAMRRSDGGVGVWYPKPVEIR
jgi:hypothetical protein